LEGGCALGSLISFFGMSKRKTKKSFDLQPDQRGRRRSHSFKEKTQDGLLKKPNAALPSFVQPPTKVTELSESKMHETPTPRTGSNRSHSSMRTPSAMSSCASGRTQRANMRHVEIQDVDDNLLAETFYHGVMEKNEVNLLLKKDGDFLVCIPCTSDDIKQAVVSLAVRFEGKTRFFIIGKTLRARFHITRNCFDSIPLLVRHYMSTREALSLQLPIVIKRDVPMPDFIITHSRIIRGDLIGRGAFGKVFKATLVTGLTLRTVAVKKLKNRNVQDAKRRSLFLQEARTMKEYSHPNIVNFIGFAGRQEPLMIVLEFCANGCLLNYLRAKGPALKTDVRMRFVTDAAAGMSYLESLKCIHRDIAARNCLLDEHMNLKISDFGMSIKENQESGHLIRHPEEENNRLPVKWLAPEIIRFKEFSIKSDVWAYGIFLYEVFTNGSEPYSGITTADVRNLVGVKRYRMEIPTDWPPSIYAIIQGCFEDEPTKRPTFKEIHECLKKANVDSPNADQPSPTQ